MSHARGQDDAAETTRSTSATTTSSDPLRDSLDELSRLADSLVDGLSETAGEPTAAAPSVAAPDAPATAVPASAASAAATTATTATARSALSETIEQLGQYTDPEPPLRSGEPVLEGDRGEDIDAFLDAVLTPEDDEAVEAALAMAPAPIIEAAVAPTEPVASLETVESIVDDLTDAVTTEELTSEPRSATPETPASEVVVEFPEPLEACSAQEPAAEEQIAADAGEATLAASAIEIGVAGEALGGPGGPGDPNDLEPPEYCEPDLSALDRSRGGGIGWWIAVAIVVGAVAFGAWWLMAAKNTSATTRTTSTTAPRPSDGPRTGPHRGPSALTALAGDELDVQTETNFDQPDTPTGIPVDLESIGIEPDAALPAAAEAEEAALAARGTPVEEPSPAGADVPRPRRAWSTPPPPTRTPQPKRVTPQPTPAPARARTPTVDTSSANTNAVEPVARTLPPVERDPAPSTVPTAPPPSAPVTKRTDTVSPGVRFVPGPVDGTDETLSLDLKSTSRDEAAEPSGASASDRSGALVAQAVPAPTVVAAPYRPPVVIERREPNYPARALKRGAGGEVVLRVLVSETGAVVRVVVDDGPDSELEAAAIEAVLHWKYRPARDGGRAVRGWVTERFAFKP